MDTLGVFAIAFGTAVATGLGALPLAVFRHPTPRWLGVSNALAAGFMAGAAIGLFYEGGSVDRWKTVVGAVVGVGFVMLTSSLLGHREDLHIGALRGAGAQKALMIIGVMTLHSFTEGVGVGVSFGDRSSLGILIALAIAIHNIPEGLAISLVMVPSGSSVRTAAVWSIFSSLPQPLMAVPAFLGVRVFESLLPAGLGFAGGAMLWMVVTNVLPDAVSTASKQVVALAAVGGALVMLALGALLVF